MTYAIEIKQEENRGYMIIDGDKVVYRMGVNPFLALTRVNLEGFTIQPGRVFFYPALNEVSAKDRRQVFNKLIQQGVTMVVTTYPVSDPKYINKNMSKARHVMINSPIDYVIGVSVESKDLTPTLVIQLAKQKVPFIIFDFEEWDHVYSLPWEWIREACACQNPLFIPRCQSSGPPRQKKKQYVEWLSFAKTLHIPSISPFINDQPLNTRELKALGIYPIKGTLRPGADCDYVLYPTLLEGGEGNRYDEVSPSVVVIRGKIQALSQNVYRPGYGKELKIRLPYRFTDYWECGNNDG